MEKDMKRTEEGVKESRSNFLDAVETATALLRRKQDKKPMSRAFIIIAQDTSVDGKSQTITPLHMQGNCAQLVDLILHLNLREESGFLCESAGIILDHKNKQEQEEEIKKGMKIARNLAAKLAKEWGRWEEKKDEGDDHENECRGCGGEEMPVCGDCGCVQCDEGCFTDAAPDATQTATAAAQADLCVGTAPYLGDAEKE